MTADAVGGVWNYALTLSEVLAEHGIEVALAVIGPAPSSDQHREAAQIPDLRLYTLECKLEWMENPWQDVARAGRWLLRLTDLVQPDLIHLNGYCHAHLQWGCPVVVVAHSCVLSWWEAVHGCPAPASWECYRRAVAKGLAAADFVVAPTAAMLAQLSRHYAWSGRGQVIFNGISSRPLQSVCKRNYIFAAGRLWDEAKNFSALDEAAAGLQWPVYAAGDHGSSKSGFRNIHALGFLPPQAILNWYAAAGIYALPAKYEPFGLSILEAARAGCALVLGDIPSLREIWGDAALFVAPSDSDSLHEALIALSSDNDLRASMAKRAGENAAELTSTRMGLSYLQVYRELMEEPCACTES
jgi:glycogen(starch) synthase